VRSGKYAVFNEQVMVIETRFLGRGWRRVRKIDYGGWRNPLAQGQCKLVLCIFTVLDNIRVQISAKGGN
jgi:hypothetical protein